MGILLTLPLILFSLPILLAQGGFIVFLASLSALVQVLFVALTGPFTTPAPESPAELRFDGHYSIHLVNTGSITRYDALLERAAAQWESIVVGDLTDVSDLESIDLFGGHLLQTSMELNISDVDDLVIGYEFATDLEPTTLGLAGPTFLREDLTPVSGIMRFNAHRFDESSEANNYAVVLREMGHVLGIGILFGNANCDAGCEANGQGAPFVCLHAQTAYEALRLRNSESLGLPVLRLANDGGGDAQCNYWDDGNFNSENWVELMTIYSSARTVLLTEVSVASLRDVSPSYVTNDSAADPVPTSLSEEVTGGIKLTNENGELQDQGEMFLLEPEFLS